MKLTEEQSGELFRRTGSYLKEACDRCGKPLAEVSYTRRGELGGWCSELCRDGSATVHTLRARARRQATTEANREGPGLTPTQADP